MKLDISKFAVSEGKKFKLRDRDTLIDPIYEGKKDYRRKLEDQITELRERQRMLYAQNQHSLLLIFQGMDTAGKDGAIRHVMSGVNPSGCQVFSFKRPSSEELDHNWMWRTTCRMPERGRIGVFNRSYYEEVLVVRVHPKILTEVQRIPAEEVDLDKIWDQRYRDIRNFEDYATRNGTTVVKIFLNVSKEEQKRRFIERIETPEKQWKFVEADLKERGYWDDYQQAYEDAIDETSTKKAPWYVVPADDKKNARLIVSEVVRSTLESLPLAYPEADPGHGAFLKSARAALEAE
ncbi:MAG: PPK2 family polyphosphate:nucleotide phosphotransferase [Bradymonadia bacterium]|jgi:PPK2 family polyphosphate:nucleotide phosphotransferase